MSDLVSIRIPGIIWGTFCEYLGLPRDATAFQFQETLSKLVEQMDDLRQTAEQQALQNRKLKGAKSITEIARIMGDPLCVCGHAHSNHDEHGRCQWGDNRERCHCTAYDELLEDESAEAK